ncbi:hypothetical protein [Streptomyces sp.]|uniref:hypothetical protein n=1 Tax=Streptomyces sp. TaxID=1931 RepID=UPI002F92395C
MGNTRKPTGKPTSLDRYRSEVKGDPFVLWIDDDEKIEIPRPTGDQMFEAEEAVRSGTSKDVIIAICGEQADALLDAIGKEDHAVGQAIAEDMREHFGLGN